MSAALALARRHAAHLPVGRRGRLLLRMGHRIAAGLPPRRAAAAEGVVREEEVDGILQDPAFGNLVAACERIRALSPEERLARLEAMALDALEVAMADADSRVLVCFVALRRAGLNPARVLAERVLRQDERARAALARSEEAAPAPSEPRPPARPSEPRPFDPVGAVLKVGAAKLRAAVRLEHALHHDGFAPLPGPGGRPARATPAQPPATPPALHVPATPQARPDAPPPRPPKLRPQAPPGPRGPP